MNRICALILLLICSANIEAATVRLEPTVISTINGATFTVNVVINDAINLMGAEIFVSFDPAKIESGTVTQGEMLGRNNATVAFFPTTITGKVGFATSRMGGNPTGITGSGTIAQLSFKYIGQGDSWLNIDSSDLRDSSLQTIQVTGTAGATATEVTHGTATTLDITPSMATITSGGTMSYTATAMDAQGKTWTVTTDTIFGSNDTLGTWTGGNIYTAGQAGTWTITGVYAGKTDTATIVVTHGTATALTIEPATRTVTTGAIISYIATARDTAGNTWTVTANTVFSSNDPKGTVTNNQYTAGSIGTWMITGTHTATGLVRTATVVVTHGTATGLIIEPSWGMVISGATVSYTATAQDTAGNTWSVTAAFSSNDTMGIFTDNVYTAGRVGTWTITGMYAGVNGIATVVVMTHGTVTRLAIEPAGSTVIIGATATYTALARDTAGNIWCVTTDTVFSSNDYWGTITGSVYTSGMVGTWMITGMYNGLIATATVIVLHESPTGILISTITDHQICHKSFNLTITTMKQGKLITYSGACSLSDITESIDPQVVQIVDGIWTGLVSIDKSMINDKITCEIAGIKGNSNAFDVFIDDVSNEPIDDEGVSLEIKSGSVGNDYCLQIIHNPNSYEINQAIQKTGILSDTLCEIRGTIATTRELISSFHRPGTLSLIYQLENLGNIDVKTLQICRLQNGQWIPVLGNVCPNDNTVRASINAPGIFCVRGVAFGKSPLDVIVYPNPCRGTEMIFRNLPEDGATIEIYDLAGDRVKKISTQRAEERWNVRNDSGQMVDSGVYFYCVIGKKESTRGKVVIIR